VDDGTYIFQVVGRAEVKVVLAKPFAGDSWRVDQTSGRGLVGGLGAGPELDLN
jgi:hypothetical protein